MVATALKQFFDRHWWIIPTASIIISSIVLYYCWQYDQSLQRVFYP